MLEIKRNALALEPQELMELERIITDEDREGAFSFLKKNIYRKLLASQENRFKSHLDGDRDPVGSFKGKSK